MSFTEEGYEALQPRKASCDRDPEWKGKTAHICPTGLQSRISFANCSMIKLKLSSIGPGASSQTISYTVEVIATSASGSVGAIMELEVDRQRRRCTR